MIKFPAFSAVILLTSSALHAAPNVAFTPVYENLKFRKPISLIVAPDGTNRQFLVLQEGKIVILPEDSTSGEAEVFLDLTGRKLIEKDFEEGLLGLAFHPKFKENGQFYVCHSQQEPKRSQIAEYKVGADGKVDMASERLLLEVPQPFWNHNSGNMLFGPDGFLYIAFGDGGKRDNPLQLAQNLFVFNGKILRIDVDTKYGDLEYGIPKDNPWYGQEGARWEIWTRGMRNPWGLSFDAEGRFWCADVGQDLWEEVNLITKGGNYGWSFREGAREFPINTQAVPENTEFVEPIHEYTRTDGTSITGGVVYRGSKIPELQGCYVYGDWGYSNIWALKVENGVKVSNEVLFHDPNAAKNGKAYQPTAFCEGPDKEIFLLSWSGKIYRIDPAK